MSLPKGVQNVVKNQANKQRYRYFNGGGIKLDGKSILDLTHPVNSLFISKNSTSPASLFGGEWEQLTADAYFKIVTNNGGSLGGTSANHKIPIESMPSHNHSLVSGTKSLDGSTDYPINTIFFSGWWDNNQEQITSSVGGSQAYYPYYYGVYAWVRVA